MSLTTYIDKTFRKASGRRKVDGVLFESYRTGTNQYVQITTDGQIMISSNHRLTCRYASIIGIGTLSNSKTGKSIRFRTVESAARAALKAYHNLKKGT